MKLRFILAISAAVLTTSYVEAFGGFFAGVNLGGNLLKGTHNYATALGTGSVGMSKFGFVYGIHGGYCMEIGNSRTIVGGQLAFNGVTGKQSKRIDVGGLTVGNFEISQKYGIEFAAIIGKLINPKVMIYTKLGFDYAKFNLKYTSQVIGVNSASIRKSGLSFLPGLGGKYMISSNFYVGAEYQFLGAYKKLSYSQPTILSSSIKPSAHRVYVTASYYF